MAALPHRPPRRGCLRGCAGCLFHHPLTVLLTGIALLFLVAQLVRAGIALATAQPLPLGALTLTTLLVILAQIGPRLASVLWRRWRTRQAEATTAAPAWRDHPAGIWAADLDSSAYQGDNPAAMEARMAMLAAPLAHGLVVSSVGSGRAWSRAAMLRNRDAEAMLVMIDPSADPPFRPLVEDHPDA